MEIPHSLWLRFEKSGKLLDYMEFCKERRRCERKPDAREKHLEEPPSDHSSL